LIRKAVIEDVRDIFSIVEEHSHKGTMLYRPETEIYDGLRDFFVYESDGEILGVCSLHIWGPVLGEIRSLAVKKGSTRRGIGGRLVEVCVKEATALGNAMAQGVALGHFTDPDDGRDWVANAAAGRVYGD